MTPVATGTGEAHPFIIPLTKIDVERRLVIGTAAEEIADKSREIMDYASARPQFESWSKEFSDATGGLSKGNLRVMHTKHVAGRLDDIAYDDQTKRVQICAKVVDDNDWQKCLDGVYTGFSIGGGYLKKWKDPDGLTRYTPIIREISLVDNPCLHTAKFAELVKADGIVGQLELVGKVRTFAEQWADRPAAVATFADSWASRPQTFGELHKKAGFDTPGFKKPSSDGLGAKQRKAYKQGADHVIPPGAKFDETKHPRDHGRFARAEMRAALVGRGSAKVFRGLSFGGKLTAIGLPFDLATAALSPFRAYRNIREEDGKEPGPISTRLGGYADRTSIAASGFGVGSVIAPIGSLLADGLDEKGRKAAKGPKLIGRPGLKATLRSFGAHPMVLGGAGKALRYGLPTLAGLGASAMTVWNQGKDRAERAELGAQARAEAAAKKRAKALARKLPKDTP